MSHSVKACFFNVAGFLDEVRLFPSAEHARDMLAPETVAAGYHGEWRTGCYGWHHEDGRIIKLLPVIGPQFPENGWLPEYITRASLVIRHLIAKAWYGAQTKDVAPAIASQCPEFCRIPFRTRDGRLVTLFGGRIHATGNRVTWDILPTNENDRTALEERLERVFGDECLGLECLDTVTLLRSVRNL